MIHVAVALIDIDDHVDPTERRIPRLHLLKKLDDRNIAKVAPTCRELHRLRRTGVGRVAVVVSDMSKQRELAQA